ncbi:MAG: hypothetical protein ACM3YM_04640, partial [Sphingomonadales bacterium]
MRFGPTIAAALMCAAFLATHADAQALSSVDEKGIKRMLVYGTDPCPPSVDGEIVVCARRPESDRYRIPERFRAPDTLTGDRESWAYKAERLEMVGRGGIASCSPVGPGGATGCMQQLIEQARRERRASAKEEKAIP